MAPTAFGSASALHRFDLRDSVLGWRDRVLASPAFRRRAAAFAPTRPMARRRARALFDLVAGFVYSQVLAACVKLHLFDILADGPLDIAELSRRLNLPAESAQRLIDAAVSLQLLEKRHRSRFGLGPLGASLVGNDAVAAMVEHHAALYGDLADPVALLRDRTPGTLTGFWPYEATEARDEPRLGDAVGRYTALMSVSQSLVADQILDAYPFRRHRRLLDIGGGDGTFLTKAGRRAPALELVLFELPAVARRAHARFEQLGPGARAKIESGNFLVDPLPAGADLATLIRVIHDHDDDAAMTILRSARRALGPGSTLLLAEPMTGIAGAESLDAYFGFYLLAMGRGRPRSVPVLTAMLEAAGFEDVRPGRTRVPLQTSLLIARTATSRGARS